MTYITDPYYFMPQPQTGNYYPTPMTPPPQRQQAYDTPSYPSIPNVPTSFLDSLFKPNYPTETGATTGNPFATPDLGGGMSDWAGGATPLIYARLIAQGKLLENQLGPDNPASKASLGLLGPSFAQVREDPVGIGLPTLLGAPFLAPFTGKKEARGTAPEWAGLMGK